MVAFLGVVGITMQKEATRRSRACRTNELGLCDSLVAIRTHAGLLIVVIAIEIGIVGECSVFATARTTTPLILKVPIEARERSMPKDARVT